MYFYGFRKEVGRNWLDAVDNRCAGLHLEGEHLRVQVRTLADCAQMYTTSTLIGLRLVEKVFGISCETQP